MNFDLGVLSFPVLSHGTQQLTCLFIFNTVDYHVLVLIVFMLNFSVLSSELTNSRLQNENTENHRHIQALTSMNQNIVEIVEVTHTLAISFLNTLNVIMIFIWHRMHQMLLLI